MLEEFIDMDPKPGSDESDQMEVLATLIEKYEIEKFPEAPADPIEAIKFRMDQNDMTQADLIPYLGSRSRVSDILNGKRSLTLEMIRKLESGLKIPADLLIKKPDMVDGPLQPQYWSTALIRKMKTYGYFENSKKRTDEDLLKEFFAETAHIATNNKVMLRQSSYTSATTDKNALYAWSIRVLKKARETKNTVRYKKNSITIEFMRTLVKLSTKQDGPIQAQERLKEKGIALIIEPHLPKTRLDGAAFMGKGASPVVGLTLRHDRLDNFWFTLMHELAHIAKHYDEKEQVFYDEEVEESKKDTLEREKREEEADAMACEALIPKSKWEVSAVKITPSKTAADMLAEELGIHPAIVAGYARHEHQNYYYLKDIVKDATVQDLFTNIKWK